MNSNKIKKRKNLAQVSAIQAQKFLEEIANLSSYYDDVFRFLKRFQKTLPLVRTRASLQKAFWPSFPITEAIFTAPKEEEQRQHNKVFVVMKPWDITLDEKAIPVKPEKKVTKRRDKTIRKMQPDEVLELQGILRQVWLAGDLRTKEFALFLLQHKAIQTEVLTTNFPFPLPPPSPFEQCLIYLRRAIDRARFCGSPYCKAPFFFAQRRNQKYCSDLCAKHSQREFKRQWWAEHGKEWRAHRKASELQKKERK